jgi:hypothetical protein
MMRNRLTTIILSIFILIPFSVSGQKLINSPFARYNLGIIEPAGSFRSIGMGRTGTAFRDNSSIYYTNPASYSSLDTNSFIFDFGLDYGINYLTADTSHYKSDDMNFDHLIMGFPIAKGWGIATGVITMSNGYYKISESMKQGDTGYDPLTGEYVGYHAGSGGLTNFFLGTGVNITKNFSVGINMTLLFGSIKRVNEYDFADFYHFYNDKVTQQLQLSGMNLDYGIQYAIPLKKDYYFNAGASFSSGKYYKSKYESITSRFSAFGYTETLSSASNDTTKAYLPGTLRMGIAFGKQYKFVLGLDYVMTNWSNAKFQGSDNYVGDTRSLLFGAEYIPDKFSNYNFLKRVEYRIGGHLDNNYLIINDKQVKEYGLSVGLGIPMRRSLSKTNIFFDYTRKSIGVGTISLHEDYLTMGISLNLYDLWFIKRKYE